MKESLNIFYGDLKNSFKDFLPIIIVIALFQGFIIQAVPANLTSIIIGLTIVAVGFALFIRGLVDAFWLRMAVALSVGFAITLGTLRILLAHPVAY